jgi:hypothetical protein
MLLLGSVAVSNRVSSAHGDDSSWVSSRLSITSLDSEGDWAEQQQPAPFPNADYLEPISSWYFLVICSTA